MKIISEITNFPVDEWITSKKYLGVHIFYFGLSEKKNIFIIKQAYQTVLSVLESVGLF